MSEAFGFDIQEYRANEAKIAALAQGTKQSEAETKNVELRNSLARKAMQTQEEVREALRNMPELTSKMGEDPATAIAGLAEIMANVGDIEGAAELLGKSATAGKATAESADLQLKHRMKQGEFLDAAMKSVLDDPTSETWNAAMIGLLEMFPEDAERLLPLATAPMNDEDFDYVETARTLSIGAITEITKLKQAKEKAEADRLRQVTEESRVRTELVLPSQAKANDARAAYLEKEGATRSRLKTATITDAKRKIETGFSNVDPSQLHGLAMKIAERTEDLVSGHPLIGRTEALNQAFQEAKNDHEFAGLTPKRGRLGTSLASPLPLPMDDGQIVPSKLLKNKFYRGMGTRAGESFLWTGTEFISGAELRSIGRLDEDFGVEDEEPEEETPGEEEQY